MEWIPISNQIHLKITNIRKLGVFDRMERKFRKRNFKFNENKIFGDLRRENLQSRRKMEKQLQTNKSN